MVRSEGESSRDSQSNSGLAVWMTIMRDDPGNREERNEPDGHADYYATDPRVVGGAVEKSCRDCPCDAKCGKDRGVSGGSVQRGGVPDAVCVALAGNASDSEVTGAAGDGPAARISCPGGLH